MSDERDIQVDPEQPDLIDIPNNWDETWKGMPSYEHRNLKPDTTLMVHFKDQADRRAFAKFIDQRLTADTKFIWYPKAEIQVAKDKMYASAKVTPRYPVYILSKGRWESRLTAKCFEWIKVPYHIVIEPQEYDQYAAVIDPAKILTLPFSNLGLGGIPARNWIWEHSISIGAERHWIFDDNISGFCRWQNNLKVEVNSGMMHCAIEDFTDRYENLVMTGFQYDYFGPNRKGADFSPVLFNTRVYSGMLLSNKVPHRWRGRYNEDTDLSLRLLKDGYCTAYFNAFMMYKKPTMTTKGGNTDELYAGMNATAELWQEHAKVCADCTACLDGYTSALMPCAAGRDILSKDGRWLMAEHLREQHPELTTIERKWGRWQHQVDYRRFKNNELKLKPGGIVYDASKYEMTLEAMEPDPTEPASRPDKPERPRPEESSPVPGTAATEQPGQPGAAPAGPSALDFLRSQAEVFRPVDQPVSGPAPASPKPEPLAKVEATAVPEQASTGQPEQPGPPPGPEAPVLEPIVDGLSAAEVKLRLDIRGHHLLTRDGKFFVSETGKLTVDEKRIIKAMRDELIPLASPWIEPVLGVDVAERTTGSMHVEPDQVQSKVSAEYPNKAGAAVAELPTYLHPSTDSAMQPTFDSPPPVPQQSLAQFLGTQAPLRSVVDWKPDEPPSLDGISDVVLNFATNGLEWANGHRPIGVTVSTLDGQLTRFLPFAFEHGGNLDEATVKRWAERELRGKKVTNSKTKFDVHMSREWGIDLEAQGCTFSDIQHTAALLDDHRKRFALDILVKDYLAGDPIVERVFVGEARHAEHHASEVVDREYFTAQAVAKLRAVMYPQVDEQELRKVHDLEDDVIPCVVEMEKNGSPIDLPLLEQYGRECSEAHDALMWEISKECGFAFEHTASGWKRLIESLQLAVPDSFSESILNEVDHPLVRKGQRAVQYASLNSKVFKAYPEHITNGILRYNINQLASDEGGTVSGRFSIGIVQQAPNEDNHTAAFGDAMVPRRLFVPGSGDYLEGDAAQIEFRLLVHYSENAKLLQAYRDDPEMSFHKKMQEMLVSYKPDMLYTHTKSYNFAAQYGARSIKLATMMGFITEREGDEIRAAKRWNDPRLTLIHEIEAAYKSAHPEASALLDRASHLAKTECDKYCNRGDALHRKYPHRGYVKTLLGRRSRFPTNYKTYIGLNRVLQGTGADIMKRKLVELHAQRKDTGFVMRITNHDAVLGDATAPETLSRVSTILNAQSFALKVPIIWKCGTGKTWADCK